MNDNPKIIVISGPNGAGKTTLAPWLLRDAFGLADYVNADPIALGMSAFQPETVDFQAGRIMLQRLHHLAEKRASFAFETTLASRTYAPWLRKLKENGYSFHLLFLWLRSQNLAIQRVRERVRMGGHSVAHSAIRRRYKGGLRNFFQLYRVLANTWVMYDNSIAGSPTLIASGSVTASLSVFQRRIWHKLEKAYK